MNRRELLTISGAALSVAIAPSFTNASNTPVAGARNFALFDARFKASQRFADAAAAQGATPLASRGDIPTLWYETLRHEGLSGMRGMTSYADMMAIAALAQEARLPMQVQISHTLRGESVSHNLLSGPSGAARLLRNAGAAWPEASWSVLAREFHPASAAAMAGNGHRATLWSWGVA